MHRSVCRIARLALVPWCLAALGGCTCDGPSEEPQVHLAVLGLRTLNPVRVDSYLVVEFSHAFVPESLGSRVWLTSDDDPEVPACLCAVDPGDSLRARITPQEPLRYGSTYLLWIDVGVESTEVEPLQTRWWAPFRTESEPGNPTAVELPPFMIVRHAIDLRATWVSERGLLSGGGQGLALLSPASTMAAWALPTGTTQRINAVWCSETGVTCVAYGDGAGTGGGVLLFANGQRTPLVSTTDAATGVAAFDEDEIFATHGNQVLAWTPSGWLDHACPDAAPLDIWAFRGATEDVLWVAGVSGLHRGVVAGDSITWETIDSGPHPFPAVAGIDADTVITISSSLVIREGPDGGVWGEPGYQWTDVAWGPLLASPVVVGLTPESHGAMILDEGYPLDPQEVSAEPLYAAHVGRIGLSDDAQCRMVGAAGTVLDFTPERDRWRTDALPKRDAGGAIARFTDVSGAIGGEVYGVRAGELCTVDHHSATQDWLPFPGPSGLLLQRVYTDAEDSIYVAGIEDGGIDRWVAHFDGSEWTRHWMSSMDDAQDLWAADPGNIFVVCDHAVSYKLGTLQTLLVVSTGGENLRGVWGTASDSAYTVGEAGLIAHYTIPPTEPSGVWTRMDSGTTRDLQAVSGTSETHIVAVGDHGTVLRYDGAGWEPMILPAELADVDLTMVWTRNEEEIWVASPTGVVGRYDGVGWRAWTIPVPGARVNAMATDYGGLPWFVGDDDLAVRYCRPPLLSGFELIHPD